MTDRPILLVEDNEDDELLTIRAFKKNKIVNPVVVVRDGAQALDYLFKAGNGKQGPPLPQVVLLDLSIPLVGGLDVLRRIRADQRTKLLPVVVLTSSKEEEDVVRSYALGANGYVRKPVEFDAFNDVVKALGLFWLLINQTATTVTNGD